MKNIYDLGFRVMVYFYDYWQKYFNWK